MNFSAERGFPPSIREIGAALGISSLRGVTVHLDALERKGWIERERTSRGIHVLGVVAPKSQGSVDVPIVGTIAAGIPIPAIENIEGYVPAPEEMVGKSTDLFALRVRGDSMTGDGVLPGDIVIVRPQKRAANGELAAVLVGDEATIKRVYQEEGRAILVSSNPAYEPIVIEREDAGVIGKVIGLIRNY